MNISDVLETSDGMRWYLDGHQRFPSVTTVLGWVFHNSDWARYDLTSPQVIYARNRGRAVHAACYWLAKGRKLNPETVDPEIISYIDQFGHFLGETRFLTFEAEVLVASKRQGYAGRADLWGSFPGEGRPELIVPDRLKTVGHLLDIKTGQVQSDMAGWQTAGYLRALREEKGLQRFHCKRSVLHLDGEKPDGWKLVALDGTPESADDWPIFLSALNVFKAAEKRGAL